MSVQIIDDKGLWDDFIQKSPYGLLCHKWDFLKIMEKYSGMGLLPYGVYKGNELICLFPFFFKQAKGLKILYSPPLLIQTYVPYLGFVMGEAYDGLRQQKKEHYLAVVADEIGQAIADLSPNIVSIYTAPRFMDVRPFLWDGYGMKTQYNYVTDLREPVDDIWDDFEGTLKKGIKALEKRSGLLQVKIENDPDVLFRIMQERLVEQGSTFWHRQRPEYLKELMAAFPDNIRMYQLYEGDEVASLQVMLEYKDRVVAWMGGTSLKDGHYTEYLVWEIMKKARVEGFSFYENWGGDMKRLCPFKAKFNPALECCQYLYKKDAFGELAGRAFYTALKIPLVRDLIV